jgi:anaerobic dimethyl sulfoxide reductase subunit C (anchor subunit)
MKGRSLIIFTILSQMAVGAFLTLGVLYYLIALEIGVDTAERLSDATLLAIGSVMVLSLLVSLFHLGTPLNAWRAIVNLRSSWLSREILFALLFTAGGALFSGLQWFRLGTSGVRIVITFLVAVFGISLVYCMARVYMLRTVHTWNTWMTPVSFFITSLLLGGLAIVVVIALNPTISVDVSSLALRWIGFAAVILIALEFIIILMWISRLTTSSSVPLRGFSSLPQRDQVILFIRLALTFSSLAILFLFWSSIVKEANVALVAILVFLLVLLAEVLGRYMFYEIRRIGGI